MTREKSYETIIVLALASLILFFLLDALWPIYLSIGFLVIGILSQSIASAIAKVWFGFSNILGVVMNFVLMFIIFYLILTPLALFQRLLGKNQISSKSPGGSYFYIRNHRYSGKDIDHPW